MPLTDALSRFSAPDQILTNEPMTRHTTFRIGGNAEVMYFPESVSQLINAIDACKDAHMPYIVIGNGSNLLVRDGGIPGLTVVLGERFGALSHSGHTLTAQAGALLSSAAQYAKSVCLSGLEFASGIPGTVGGGCAMNAGAYGGQMADVVRAVTLLKDGDIVALAGADMRFSYRSSMAQTDNAVVLAVEFALTPGDGVEILAKMNDFNQRRRDKQPLSLPSAGSVFKRPEGHFAGALIEGAGLKGLSVGGAKVSEKHAGFIVNTGGARARDVLMLIKRIQAAVYERWAVRLDTEIRVIGVD